MSKPKTPLVVSILIITVGVGWLLSALKVDADINWVWTLGLGVVGILTFVIAGGIDKMSVVLGPWFLAAALLSVPHQKNQINFNIEVAILVILLGVLIFIAQMSRIRKPHWFTPLPGEKRP